jgi:F-type H+-transporting ATPase subunit b
MMIDWFTVGAQVLNFLILVWMMKRFLYRPILRAIDEREDRIAGEIAEAGQKWSDAEAEREEFQKKNRDMDNERGALLTQAKIEADDEHTRLVEEARKVVDAQSLKRQAALKKDARNINQSIARRIQDEVFAMTRQVLSDLASIRLEELMVDAFTHRLHALDEATKTSFGNALKHASSPPLVCSAFELPPELRQKILDVIHNIFSSDIALLFETKPNLVSGIEIKSGGHKVAWSISHYLASLEKSISELVDNETRPGHRSDPMPENRETGEIPGKTIQPAGENRASIPVTEMNEEST